MFNGEAETGIKEGSDDGTPLLTNEEEGVGNFLVLVVGEKVVSSLPLIVGLEGAVDGGRMVEDEADSFCSIAGLQ